MYKTPIQAIVPQVSSFPSSSTSTRPRTSSPQQQQETLVRTVTPRAVFNLNLFEGYLLIDTRARTEFASAHIASAVHFDPVVAADPRKGNDALATLVDDVNDQVGLAML